MTMSKFELHSTYKIYYYCMHICSSIVGICVFCLPFLLSREGETLQFSLLTEDNVVATHHQEATLDLLHNTVLQIKQSDIKN